LHPWNLHLIERIPYPRLESLNLYHLPKVISNVLNVLESLRSTGRQGISYLLCEKVLYALKSCIEVICIATDMNIAADSPAAPGALMITKISLAILERIAFKLPVSNAHIGDVAPAAPITITQAASRAKTYCGVILETFILDPI